MALWPAPRMHPRYMDDCFHDMGSLERRMMHDFDRLERGIMPYWRDADHSILHVANQTQEVVNDDRKFAVSLDVSQFKPEELKVHIDGRDLTIEGKQQQRTDHGYIERSFVRKWALPEEVDLDAVHTQLNDVGHLSVEAPKTGEHTNRRNLPIMPAPKKK